MTILPSGSHLYRRVASRYADGVYEIDGNLPSARAVSRVAFAGDDGLRNARNLTTMLVFFSRFLLPVENRRILAMLAQFQVNSYFVMSCILRRRRALLNSSPCRFPSAIVLSTLRARTIPSCRISERVLMPQLGVLSTVRVSRFADKLLSIS